MFDRRDLAWGKDNKKRHPHNLDEVQFLFKMLDKEVKCQGTLKKNQSRDETVDNFYKIKHVWGISDKTPGGQKRDWKKITWGSVLRLMPKEKKKRNDEQQAHYIII